MFRFQPRWKEELIVEFLDGRDGAFMLEIFGNPATAYLPTEAAWRARTPGWAHDLWPQLHDDLRTWCAENRIGLAVEAGAHVY